MHTGPHRQIMEQPTLQKQMPAQFELTLRRTSIERNAIHGSDSHQNAKQKFPFSLNPMRFSQEHKTARSPHFQSSDVFRTRFYPTASRKDDSIALPKDICPLVG